MAFVNEYISEDDIKKYDLETLDKKSEGYKRSWVIDRDSETWLIHRGTGKEDDGVKWLFYWQSNVYRIGTQSLGYSKEGQSLYVSDKVVYVLDISWQQASILDAREFLNALKAAMETRKGYGMANTELQNSMAYHVDLVL